MDLARSRGTRPGPCLFLALLVALAAPAMSPAAPPAATACPTFRVLHNDRIGPARLPAGNYEVIVETGLSCSGASQLLARFLGDYDGNLPKPWRIVAERSGRASFTRGGLPGFSVSRIELASDGANSLLGKLCAGTFTVNAGAGVGPLFFPKGRYLIYIPARSGITCRRASVLFTRFLSSPGGVLPAPWMVGPQTATFFSAPNPVRSAFRVEPLAGAQG